MPLPIAYGVYLLGGLALRVGTKKVAELLVKRGAKKLSENAIKKLAKPPTTVTPGNVASVLKNSRTGAGKPAPKTSPSKAPRNPPKKLKQPQSADSGKFQKPSPSPTIKPKPKTTSPTKNKSSSTGITRPKNTPNVGGSRIVGMNPKAMRGPGLKLGAMDFEPDFVLKDPPAKKYDKGPGGDQHPPATKKKEPVKKKEPAVKKTEGKMTLRKYLNDAIKKRGSSLTAEKKDAGKYKSIPSAKKAGSLYYTNKSGKVMAAVHAEDLKK